jgi:hypothetical protein
MSDSVIMGANWWVDKLNCRKRMDFVRLPNLNKAREAYVAGGGFFRFSMPGEIEELEAQLGMRGSHEDVRGLFGNEPGDWTTLYYYERLRDIMAGKNRGRVVIMKGLLQQVEQPRIQGKRADVTTYTFGSIVTYKDITDGKVVHLMDFDNNQLVMNGVSYSDEHNRLIAASGGAAALVGTAA